MTDDGSLDPDIQAMLHRQADVSAAPEGVEHRLFARLATSIPALGAGAAAGGTSAFEEAGANGVGGVGGTLGAGTSGASVASAVGSTVFGSKLMPLVVAFVLGGSAGVVGTRVLMSESKSAPAIVYVDRPISVVKENVSAVPTVAVETLPSTAKPTPPPTDSSDVEGTPVPSRSESVAERLLLDEARTALTRGDYDAALRVLSDHAKKYPAGKLEEEREAIAIRVLAEGAHMDEARARARRFRARFPRSLLLPAVEAAVVP